MDTVVDDIAAAAAGSNDTPVVCTIHDDDDDDDDDDDAYTQTHTERAKDCHLYSYMDTVVDDNAAAAAGSTDTPVVCTIHDDDV